MTVGRYQVVLRSSGPSGSAHHPGNRHQSSGHSESEYTSRAPSTVAPWASLDGEECRATLHDAAAFRRRSPPASFRAETRTYSSSIAEGAPEIHQGRGRHGQN